MIDGKLFKWVGGKKWLAPKINEILKENINENIDYYIEPFAGGLGSFLYVLPTLKEKNINNIILNDINGTLIDTYKAIKSKKNKIFKEYWAIENEYKLLIPKSAYKLHPTKDKKELRIELVDANEFFYQKRNEFNIVKNTKNSTEAISLFLFLSQHSFNGLYRENLKGEYNSPYNWEINIPNKKTKKNLIEQYSSIFKEYNITFENRDVFSFLRKYRKKHETAIFYFDPPYLNEKMPENKYNKDHFDKIKQDKLLNEYKKLNNIIFSNHYINIFVDFSIENDFIYKEVYRNNIMTSKSENRGEKIKEILSYRFI